MSLSQWGWDSRFQEQFASLAEINEHNALPARVTQEERGQYQLAFASDNRAAKLTGKLRHAAERDGGFPAVGDWVAATDNGEGNPAQIHAVLPRRTFFSRAAAGSAFGRQAIAANVDTAFLVSGLDNDFNLRRMERYLTVAWDSGVEPVILLNKADLCDDVEARVAEAERVSLGAAVIALSASTGDGLRALARYLFPGNTVALLGSSGVGKSTLLNRLLGAEAQATQDVRAHDSHGRHTTTSRQLFQLPGGALLLDTPGMRELQVWAEDSGLDSAFPDVDALGERCKFRDCTHAQEPGCAVQAALEEGSLDAGRYRNYLQLRRELAHLARKVDAQARSAEQKKWKQIAVWYRKNHKNRKK